MKTCWPAALLAALSACSSEPDRAPGERTELEILDHRAPCSGEGTMMCLLVRSGEPEQFTYFYDGIEGLEPAWGVGYRVLVDRIPLEEPLLDGPSVETVLAEVIEESPVAPGTEFDFTAPEGMWAPGNAPFATVHEDGGTLLDGEPFACSDRAVCDGIAAAMAGGFSIRFAYGDPVDGPLQALAIDRR